MILTFIQNLTQENRLPHVRIQVWYLQSIFFWQTTDTMSCSHYVTISNQCSPTKKINGTRSSLSVPQKSQPWICSDRSFCSTNNSSKYFWRASFCQMMPVAVIFKPKEKIIRLIIQSLHASFVHSIVNGIENSYYLHWSSDLVFDGQHTFGTSRMPILSFPHNLLCCNRLWLSSSDSFL